MKSHICIIFSALALTLIAPSQLVAADKDKAKSADVELNADEIKFRDALTDAVFVGRWCMVKDGQLGPNKNEKYTISSAKKIDGEKWIVSSRMQFGDKNVTVPIPVSVKFGGDTPIITLDKLWIPGVGTYSARVLVYDGTYAGTWSGPGYGGLLNGVITHPENSEKK